MSFATAPFQLETVLLVFQAKAKFAMNGTEALLNVFSSPESHKRQADSQ